MGRCLIGYTGFVGGNLKSQALFDELYNSSNISDIRGKEFELIVCAGAPAAKWIANRNPEDDLRNINFLINNLKQVRAHRFILISTVDVYKQPVNVNEDTPTDALNHQPYGKHRFYLEEFIRDAFSKHNIIRLHGLFGNGLKKNVIYDFINNNCLEMIHCDSVFQFYNLNRLFSDIDIVLRNDLPIVNFSTQPVSIKELAAEVFGIDFKNRTEMPPVFYDVRSKYSKLFNSKLEYYMFSKEEVLGQIRNFVVSLDLNRK